MAKYTISQPWSFLSVIGTVVKLFFIGLLLFSLYVLATTVHPLSGSDVPLIKRIFSIAFYILLLCFWLGLLVFLAAGMRYQWTEVDRDGLVVHIIICGIIWPRRVISASSIAAVERFDKLRKLKRSGDMEISGIQVRLKDGATVILVEKEGYENYHQETSEIRFILGMQNIEM